LSARERGLGGVITTVATRRENDVRAALNIPDTYAVASVLVLGYPRKRPTKLSRRSVETFTTLDSFNGEPLKP
jgi:nitroreductase